MAIRTNTDILVGETILVQFLTKFNHKVLNNILLDLRLLKVLWLRIELKPRLVQHENSLSLRIGLLRINQELP